MLLGVQPGRLVATSPTLAVPSARSHAATIKFSSFMAWGSERCRTLDGAGRTWVVTVQGVGSSRGWVGLVRSAVAICLRGFAVTIASKESWVLIVCSLLHGALRKFQGLLTLLK